MITKSNLIAIMPYSYKWINPFIEPLNAALIEFGIDTPPRISAFIAQAAHESGQFSGLVENLNYSAAGLAKTWPRRFTPKMAAEYARRPEWIANRVYANRLGNGDEVSGDGWRYRGRGIFQTTGKDNYRACSLALYGDEYLIERPELLEQPDGACRSAGYYWQSNDLNKWADAGDFDGVADVINRGRKTIPFGDAIGFGDRAEYYKIARSALGVA